MAETSRWKLGLGGVLSALGCYVGLMVLAAQLKAAEPLLAITYLDESAQGLRVDADVQMRGVRIGRVKAFGLAPDHRHVRVVCELDERTLRMLGIRDVHATWGQGEFAPPKLRAFLASTGLTGVLVIQLDFFEPAEAPLPELGFEPPWNYVPAVTSFQAEVTRDLPATLAALPRHLERVDEVLNAVDELLTELDLAAVSSRTRGDLAAANASLSDLDVAAIESETLGLLAGFKTQLDEARTALEGFEQDEDLEARMHDLVSVLEKFNRTLEDFRAQNPLEGVQQGSEGLVRAARGLSEPLRALRAWAKSMRELSRSVDGSLRPLDEDPSELFFEREPREPLD